MAQNCLNTIQKYSNQELVDFVTKNGFSEFHQILTSREITGDQFLKLTEFEVLKWKLPIPERRKLVSFLQEIQTNPEKYFALQKPITKSVKKPSFQNAKIKEQLELVIGNKNPETTAQRLDTLVIQEKKPQIEEYLDMNRPPFPQSIDEEMPHYDEGHYLIPVSKSPEVEELNYEAIDDPVVPISERKPLALPRGTPPTSPNVFPRVISRKLPLPRLPIQVPDEEIDYEPAPPSENLSKNEELEDVAYKAVPESSISSNTESLSKKITKWVATSFTKFAKKKEKAAESPEGNINRPLPTVPNSPEVLSVENDPLENVYENTEKIKVSRRRAPSPEIGQSNTLPLPPKQKMTKSRSPSPEYLNKESEDSQSIKLLSQINTLPLPPRKKIADRSPSPELIYSNEEIEESQPINQGPNNTTRKKHDVHSSSLNHLNEDTTDSLNTRPNLNKVLPSVIKKQSVRRPKITYTDEEIEEMQAKQNKINQTEPKTVHSLSTKKKFEELEENLRRSLLLPPKQKTEERRSLSSELIYSNDEQDISKSEVQNNLSLRRKPRTPSPELIYSNEEIEETQTESRPPSQELIYLNEENKESQEINLAPHRNLIVPLKDVKESHPLKCPAVRRKPNDVLPPPPPLQKSLKIFYPQKNLPKPPNSLPEMPLDLELVCDEDSGEEYGNYIFNVNDEPYYRNTDRKGAKQLLHDLGDGAFLYRPSKNFFLTLSVKYEGKYHNLGIEKSQNNKIRLNGIMSPEFATLSEMTTYFIREKLSFNSENKLVQLNLKKLLPRDRF